jgi:hypothetical protein
LTWVIGLPGFDFAIGIADMRVTVRDESGNLSSPTDVHLRKLYPIAPNAVAGFAGNVDTGLRAIEALRTSWESAVAKGCATPEECLATAVMSEHAWRTMTSLGSS